MGRLDFDEVGNYQLLNLIGTGAYGRVYLAEHRYLPSRPQVAVKILHSALPLRQEQDRFLREAHILDVVKHPHILPLIDAGVIEGFPYLVVTYATGGSLREKLDVQPGVLLPVEEALRILLQIGSALQTAHDRTIVHRDLKPANILFSAHEESLLADFGIAVVLQTLQTTHHTRVLGTPTYMAPEQFQGRVSPQSDQYALGCIAYELLTGQKVFSAPNVFAYGYQHSTQPPTPLRTLNPNIPLDLERAVLTTLEKEPAQRFSRIEEFLSVIQAVALLTQEGIYGTQAQVQPTSPVLLISGSSAGNNTPTELQGDAMKSAEECERLRKQAQMLYAQGLREQSLDALIALAQEYPHNGAVYNDIGGIRLEFEQYEGALAAFEQAINLGWSSPPVFLAIGRILHTLGRDEEALPYYEEVLRIRPTSIRTHLLKAASLEALGHAEEALLILSQAAYLDNSRPELYRESGRLFMALERFQEACDAFASLLTLEPNDADAALQLGKAHYYAGQYEEALSAAEIAISIEYMHAEAFLLKGDALYQLERYVEALSAYEQNVRLAPDSARGAMGIGNVRFQFGDYALALDYSERSLDLEPTFALAWRNKGVVLERLGQQRQAQRAYKKARKLGYPEE